MPDRLAELVRQRALVLEHLDWLEREIATAKSVAAPSAMASASSPPATTSPASESATSATTAAPGNTEGAESRSASLTTSLVAGMPPEAEIILDQYRATSATVKQDVRKGCFLYFAAAFVVLGLVVAILYFTIGSR